MSQLPAEFSIDVGSDQEHERLVALAVERGRGQFDFEHNWQAPGAESDVSRCPVTDFLVAVQAAAEHLQGMKHRDAD